jgi:hypothetical protein
MTLKTPSGTGIEVPVGIRQYLYCDGINVVEVQAAATGAVSTATNALNLGGIAAAFYARLDVANQFTKGLANTFLEDTDGATITINVALAKNHRVILAGNRVISLTGVTDGVETEIWLVQDAGGNRTVTWPGNVSFEGGTVPILSTAADAIDRFQGTYHLAMNKWVFRPGQNVGAGASTTVNIQQGGNNMKLFDMAGRPPGVVNLSVTVNYGVMITSLSPRVAALDLTGFTSGSTLTINNRGRILGLGGSGAKGGATCSGGADDFGWGALPGEAGGLAILGPGSGITCNIANIEGYIWGGGGGGGGAGATSANGSQCSGGGGGGGAPFGHRGEGGQSGHVTGPLYSTGHNGLAGLMDTGGTGGAGGTPTGSGVGGVGGAGGGPGATGTNGAAPTGDTYSVPGGAGGAAGLAINQNGGTVTVSSGASAPNLYGLVV